MMPYEIAHKYSKALFDIGQEQDSLISYKEELEYILNQIQEHEELNRVFFHPQILPEDKKEIVNEIFGEEVSKIVLNFLRVLIEKRREIFLEPIVSEYKKMVFDAENIIEIDVIAAIDLNDHFKQKIQSRLEQMLDYSIILNLKKEPEMIGGLILKIGDNIIDGSIRNKLETLKERIDQIPVSELGV